MDTAKVFWSGRSQAVRLPKSFRFNTNTVRIRRQGNAIILDPVVEDWLWLDAFHHQLDRDFVNAAQEELPQQKRSALDELFE